MTFNLSHATMISGKSVLTLEDAAYLIRQEVIDVEDNEGRRIVHFLRDANTHEAAFLAERNMREWMSVRALAKLRDAIATMANVNLRFA